MESTSDTEARGYVVDGTGRIVRVGDEVVTTCGVHGWVEEIDPNLMLLRLCSGSLLHSYHDEVHRADDDERDVRGRPLWVRD